MKLESHLKVIAQREEAEMSKPHKKPNKKKRQKRQKKVESDDEDFMLDQMIAENQKIENQQLYLLETSAETRREYESTLHASENEYEDLAKILTECNTIETKYEQLRLVHPLLYVHVMKSKNKEEYESYIKIDTRQTHTWYLYGEVLP